MKIKCAKHKLNNEIWNKQYYKSVTVCIKLWPTWGPGFEPMSGHYDFRVWVSPVPFKVTISLGYKLSWESDINHENNPSY